MKDEWKITTELVLGIIGTVTGILGLIIHYTRLRKEKPNLETEITYCLHLFHMDNLHPNLRFKVWFRINNKGDRGTTIHEVDLLSEPGGHECPTKGILFHLVGTERLSIGRIRVEANETTEFVVYFIESEEWMRPYATKEKSIESIDCKFIIHHTYGKEDVIGSSRIGKKKEIMPPPLPLLLKSTRA